jgi:large subunit ribosomal protein L19e
MKLTVQKRLAADVLKTSPKKVRLDTAQLENLKEAITKADIRSMVSSGAITKKKESGHSRGRARKNLEQKRKGRKSGLGSRKGKHTARAPSKQEWMHKIRAQREFLKVLREKGYLNTTHYRMLYSKCQGGYFRNVRHIKLYIAENQIATPKGSQ